VQTAVLGSGNLGRALIRGWVSSGVCKAAEITLPGRASALPFAEELGLSLAESNAAAVTSAEIVVLAVKPWLCLSVLAEVKNILSPDALIVSVAAGVPLSALEMQCAASPIIRAMPNTPSRVGAGATAFCRGARTTDAHAAIASQLFSAVGLCAEVTEPQLDAVIGVAGSSPAYVFLFIEALTDGGVRMGLPRATAQKLAAQAVFGAAKLVLESGEHPAALKDAVTTPGGTTIAALEALERGAFRGLVIEAVRTAAERSQELSKPK
jgi:pyrroline-5-carboxylate reductase